MTPDPMGIWKMSMPLELPESTEIECCDLYFIRGEITEAQVRQLADSLLHDPVTHTVETDILEMSADNM